MQIPDRLLEKLIHGDITCWTQDDAVLYGKAVAALMTGGTAIDAVLIASCTCTTKTPDPSYHNRQCQYRLIYEVQAELWRLQSRRSSLITNAAENVRELYRTFPGE